MTVENGTNTSEWERLAESIGWMIEKVALSIHETDLTTMSSHFKNFQIEKLHLDTDKLSENET